MKTRQEPDTIRLGLAGVGRIGTLHARNLAELGTGEGTLPPVQLVIADAAAERAHTVAQRLGAASVPSAEALLDEGIDGLVIAAGTLAHPDLVRMGVDAGVPVFCEKPLAGDTAASLPVLEYVQARGGVVQMGHQRRFDAGYLAAKRLLQDGALGWVQSFRAVTSDMEPPPVGFLASSGGLFRDCSVHDFDILRWLTGREIVRVYAVGSNKGDPEIGRVGDIDTGLALVTLDDGTVGTVSAARYNGAGHDVRLEIAGSRSTLLVGLDDTMAVRSAEPGVDFPSGRPPHSFAERFEAAYRAEMAAFVELVLGRRDNPCTPVESVAASRVADAAQESLLTGLPVNLG